MEMPRQHKNNCAGYKRQIGGWSDDAQTPWFLEDHPIYPTRWAPASYKWSYNPYKWPYN